jgi:predicted dinucleotide-binding enzyme
LLQVFNSIFFVSLENGGKPAGTPGRIALPVAGDDASAKARVQRLVDSIGFDSVDAGSLSDSWRQQPGTPCYCKDLPADELKRTLAAADKSRIAQDRKATEAATMQNYPDLAAAQRKAVTDRL